MTHLRKTIAIVGGIIVIITALLGSKSLRDFIRSPESKINNAVPISEKLRLVKTAVFETSSSPQWKEIEEELEARMKIRALYCAKGYSPAFYVTMENVKKNLTDLNCFADTDNDIAYWLGLRRVGILLSKPALKPIPTFFPSFIVADNVIENITFAGNAGVAMLETAQELQIVDIDSQKSILRELKGSSVISSITPNGRLFITGETNRLKIRETESGAVIAELNGIRPQEFHWLDGMTALYNKIGSEKTFLMDFSTGKEIPVQAINKHVTRVARMPQTTNQFAAFSAKGITKIELLHTPTGVEAKLLDEKHDTAFSTESHASGITSDGFHYFHAGRQITIVSLNTLTTQTMPLGAFQAKFAVTMPDPDLILLVGAGQTSGEGGRSMLYSISKRSTTPLERSRVSAQGYLYANILKRHAVITDNKIALLEILPPPITASSTTAASPPTPPSSTSATANPKTETATKTAAPANVSSGEKAAEKVSAAAKQPEASANTPPPATSPKPPAPASVPPAAAASASSAPTQSLSPTPAAPTQATQPQAQQFMPTQKQFRPPRNT